MPGPKHTPKTVSGSVNSRSVVSLSVKGRKTYNPDLSNGGLAIYQRFLRQDLDPQLTGTERKEALRQRSLGSDRFSDNPSTLPRNIQPPKNLLEQLAKNTMDDLQDCYKSLLYESHSSKGTQQVCL